MTQAKQFNFLSHGPDALQGELRPAVAMYYRKLFDYEAELRDMPQHELTDEQITSRISAIASRVAFGIFASPKNEDGQTAAVLFANGHESGHIDILFVNKSYRGQRLGRQLVEQFQRARPGVALTVEVARPNATAKMFYERLGFKFTGGSHPAVLRGTRDVVQQ